MQDMRTISITLSESRTVDGSKKLLEKRKSNKYKHRLAALKLGVVASATALGSAKVYLAYRGYRDTKVPKKRGRGSSKVPR